MKNFFSFTAASLLIIAAASCSEPFPDDFWFLLSGIIRSPANTSDTANPSDPVDPSAELPSPGTVTITADSHQRPGLLTAEITINPAADESLIDGYRVYWSTGTQLGTDHTKTGSAIKVNLTGQSIPAGASGISVRTTSGSTASAAVQTTSFTDIAKYYIFATTDTFNGNIAGITSYNDKDSNSVTLTGSSSFAKADEICNLEKLYAVHSLVNPGTFKALLVGTHNGHTRTACTTPNCSDGVTEHSDWVLTTDRAYIRAETLPAAEIGTTNSLGLFSINGTDSLSNAFITTADTYWTGLDNNGTAITYLTATDNCSGWSSDEGLTSGQYGTGNETGLSSLSDSFGAVGCDQTKKILCAEQ